MVHYFILYSYKESPGARKNLSFFIKQAVFDSPDTTYIFAINGQKCSLQLPKYGNVNILRRKNMGHDFGAWSDALSWLKANRAAEISANSRYIFINDTVCGPFIPRYVPARVPWYEQFTSLLSERVKLSGLTINSSPWANQPDRAVNRPGSDRAVDAHVQSMAFCMDSVGLEVGLSPRLTTAEEMAKLYAKDRKAFIRKYEIGMSTAIMDAGFEIAALYMADLDKMKTWQAPSAERTD